MTGAVRKPWTEAEIGIFNPFVTSGSRGWGKYYSESGDLFLRITNLRRSDIHLDLSDTKLVRLPVGEREGTRTSVQSGDVLISITADIGVAGYVDERVPMPAYINQHIALVRFPKDTLEGRFVAYYLASEGPQKTFRAMTDTGAKAGMSLSTVKKIKVLCPPLEEQKAIALALNRIDDLIASLDALIAKKRDIKQAAMHQLLTGMTRLPGYSADWDSWGLGQIVEFFKGRGLPKSALKPGGSAPCIHYGELFTHYGPTISTVTSRTFETASATLSRANDVLMPTSDVTPRGLAKASCVLLDGVIIGGDALIIRPDATKLDGVFLAYLIRQSEAAVLNLVRGSTVFHIYAPDLARLEVRLPKIEEQTAIAEVLRDMDRELEQLAVKRAKTALIRDGMMQTLLSGKIRLS